MTDAEIEQRVMETEAREYAFWEAHSIGVKAERERIIKLLEKEPPEKWFFVGFRQYLIALIKGENK